MIVMVTGPTWPRLRLVVPRLLLVVPRLLLVVPREAAVMDNLVGLLLLWFRLRLV